MGYKCSFLDNEEYGADDVSQVFSRLIGSGVLAYPDGTTVAQSLNTMTADTVSAGAAPYGGAKVEYSDGVIKIGEGDIFFESGVCASIDSDGIEIDCENAAELYIAMVYEEHFNRVVPYVDTQQPEGDAVLLAYINAASEVIDLRSYAAAKIGINSANVYHDFSVTLEKSVGTESDDNYTTIHTLPSTDFHYLLLRSANCAGVTTDPAPLILDISEDGKYEINPVRGSSLGWRLKIRRMGTKLGFYSYYVGGNGRNNAVFSFTAV